MPHRIGNTSIFEKANTRKTILATTSCRTNNLASLAATCSVSVDALVSKNFSPTWLDFSDAKLELVFRLKSSWSHNELWNRERAGRGPAAGGNATSSANVVVVLPSNPQ